MQNKLKISGLLALGWIFVGFGPVLAQSFNARNAVEIDPLRVQLADLEQDVAYLKTIVAQLRLEIEQLARENTELERSIESQAELLKSFLTEERFTQTVHALRDEMKSAGEARNRQVISEVSKQLERLANQTDEALRALAKSIDVQPEIVKLSTFSDNYPRDGIVYKVLSGDTLSEIAQKFNSTVRDIQDANHIDDPTKLKVGRTLFIPQETK